MHMRQYIWKTKEKAQSFNLYKMFSRFKLLILYLSTGTEKVSITVNVIRDYSYPAGR